MTVKYWCCEKGANLAKPWYDRNNCYITIGVFGTVILILVALGILLICPIPYVMGLITQVIIRTDKIGYGYWMNVFLGWFGFMLVCIGLFVLAGVVYILCMLGQMIM